MRNNLQLGKRIEKVEHPEESKCYICNEHKETRVLIFLGCNKSKNAPIFEESANKSWIHKKWQQNEPVFCMLKYKLK